nr:hypothetical protein [Tanacetum cinerariifolium]
MNSLKGFDIGIQEKKAKLFNEWERFTSNEGESIESYYHHFLKLMNDLKSNKHFPEKIASNLKFLNNLQPEWSRHVIIVHQTNDLYTADYTQLYDFLKYNQKERISSNPKNRQIAQPGMNMGQDRQMQMIRGNGRNQFRQNARNPAGYNDVMGNQIGNGNLVAARVEGNVAGQNGNQIRCYNCRGVEEYDLMAAAADLDEIEEVNANCILMANLQEASTSGTQTDSAPVYDSDGSAEVHNYENCYDNEIFNMFTQEKQYTELLEPIPKSHQVPQNDNDVISEDTSVEQEFQVLNYARKNTHLKATYKNLFDSISVSRAQTKTIIVSLQNELQSNIYKNANLRTHLFKKVSDQKNNTLVTSENTKFAKQPIVEIFSKVGKTNALSKSVTSNSISKPQEPKSVNNDKVIAPGMFRIDPSKTSREEKHMPNIVSASARKKPITVSQPPVITKKDVNSDLNGLSSTGIVNTKTRRPQPRSNTKND